MGGEAQYLVSFFFKCSCKILCFRPSEKHSNFNQGLNFTIMFQFQMHLFHKKTVIWTPLKNSYLFTLILKKKISPPSILSQIEIAKRFILGTQCSVFILATEEVKYIIYICFIF